MSGNEFESSDIKLDIDAIYEKIGGFGKFQCFVLVLICIPLTFIVCCNFSFMFFASDLDYRCLIPECDSYGDNGTSEWLQKAVPYVNGKIAKCERFAITSRNDSDNSVCPWNFNQSHVVQCDKFIYLTDERMILNEFNLTCHKNQWKLALIGSLGSLSECIALPIIGLLADKYGRRPVIIYSIAMVSIFGIAKSFSPNYITFIILHMIGALFGGGAFGQTFVMGSEVIGLRGRSFGAGIVGSAVSVGQILLTIVAMYINDFRLLLRILYGMVAFTLTFIWLLPESARWLLTVGRNEEGFKVLEKVAKFNGKKMPAETIKALSIDNQKDLLLKNNVETTKKIEKNLLMTVISSKVLLGRLINCCFCYFTNGLIFTGLSVYSPTLPGDKHMNLLYCGISEILGNSSTHYVLRRLGRKSTLIISMFLCSAACLVSELVEDPTLKITFFLVGKFSVCLSYTALNIYSTELFPTNIRQSMFNICMICAGCGDVISPQIPYLKSIMPLLPLIMFGGTSFCSALLLLLLPETSNKSLPDTIEEAVKL